MDEEEVVPDASSTDGEGTAGEVGGLLFELGLSESDDFC